MIFKGGSSLRVCFDLPRLSEGLDFDYDKKFEVKKFFADLTDYFRKDQNFPQVEEKMGERRLYLKFPVLRKLGLSGKGESDKLYLKIELTPSKRCLFRIETEPIFKEGFNFLVRRYSLEDLMAGKINAVLARVWFKGKKNEIKAKGRDFFDLYWFMKKKVVPNYDCIFYKNKKISSQEVWNLVEKRVKAVSSRDIEYDIDALIKEKNFPKNFSSNFKSLFEKELVFYIKK